MRRVLASLVVLTILVIGTVAARSSSGSGRFEVKAIALTMFSSEEGPWLANESWPLTFNVPGGFSPVHCQRSGVCVAQLGTTKSHSGPSTMAILRDPRLRFTERSIFIIDGIAGIRSNVGTLGTVGIANWIVDVELGTHFVRPVNAPPHGWLPFGDFEQAALHLNERLARFAFRLTKDVPLADDATAQAERVHYGAEEASEKPTVKRCDNAGTDQFWVGDDWAAKADHIVRERILVVDPTYDGFRCSSEFEDPAVASALRRFGFLDQLISVRAASDFEDERPGTTPRDLYDLFQSPEGFAGFSISVENGYRVATKIAHFVASHPNVVDDLV